MNRLSFFILCALLGLLSVSAADPGKLLGRVTDATTGKPVAGAIVRAKGSFTSTDSEGWFTLALKAGADSVTFRCLGYAPLTLAVDADMTDVRLAQKVTMLNDVIVEAPDIYAKGDTLVFNVAKYASAKDNAIIDVIKRLPGIKVEEDGTIKYQGKPINKFYIDGNDFIGGQYGLATNNISHKDVASVEVMENHQPVKALEGIDFPEEAGINLKLKEDARSRWVGVAQGGTGIEPLLYNGSLFTMRMAPKIQNVFTLKADNTGWNPANEIRDHNFDVMFSSDYAPSLWPQYISADMVGAPLSEKRTRDNRSWLADAITSWKSGDASMRLKLDYKGDHLDYYSGVVTDYFSNQIPTFIQMNAMRTQSHNLSAQFYTEVNKRGYYLKDKLTFSGEKYGSTANITGSDELSQSVSRKSFSVNNDLKLVKRNDKSLFNLTSRNSFLHCPDRLAVAGDEDAFQSLGTSDIRSTTEIRLGKLTRFWKYYITAGADMNYHRMNSSLNLSGKFDNNGIHEAFLAILHISPQIDYERNRWRISFSMPLKWCHYYISRRYDYVNTSPRISVRHQLTSKSEISGAIGYNLGSPQPYLNMDVPVLSDFRNLFIPFNPDTYSHAAAASMSYRYRNPLKSLFFNVSASYNYHRSSLMANQLFFDDFIISTYADQLFQSDTWHIKGGVSKGLGHSKMVTGLEAEVSLTSSSSMRDGSVLPYRHTSVGVKPYFKGSLWSWLSLNYEAEYGFSKLRINAAGNDYYSLRHNIFATLIPSDRVQLSLGVEHYLTRFPEGNTSNLILVDASATWRLTNRLRLLLTADNILGKRRYEYVNYGTLSESEHMFRLRGRTVIISVQYRF